MMWLQLAIVLFFLYVGARIGGAGLGLMGGLGLAVLVFGFKLQPTSAPMDVMLMILAVVCAAAALQAAGGLDYLVRLAERALRRNPTYITFVAPIVTWVFTFFAGTGHVAYSVLPVIAEVARETKIRPERPLSVAVIASQFAIIGGPISAAMVAMLSLTADKGMTLVKLMAITAPATFLGCMIAAAVMNFYGKELESDPEYQRRLAAGEIKPVAPAARPTMAGGQEEPKAKWAVAIFLLAAVAVVILGAFPSLRPAWTAAGKSSTLGMADAIQMVMLSAAALIVLVTRTEIGKVVKGSVFSAGTTAVIAIFGIAWMGDTWFKGNEAALQGGLKAMVTEAPWLFAVALFFLSVLVNSQAATTRALIPLGLTLGIPVPFLAAMLPAVNGYFFIPNYGPIVAAINFDTTGTTKIGRYVLNHSFMLPGLIATVASILIGFGLQALIW
ncbi:MAG: anaerobic C4-dicarboxylate transporter family protein [Bacillota bacterium]